MRKKKKEEEEKELEDKIWLSFWVTGFNCLVRLQSWEKVMK